MPPEMETTDVVRHRAAGQIHARGLSAAWVSDTGVVREKNEDCCLASAEAGLFLVADGMGGERAGARAARMVADLVPELLAECLLSGPDERDVQQVEDAIKDVVLEANHRVRSESARIVGKMGATLVLALVRGERLHVAHMGDSRAYLLANDTLQRLTCDHAVVDILLRRGAITSEQARCHPMRGQVSRYVGMGGNASADVQTLRWPPGARLLLCTDGLTEALTDERIEHLLKEAEPLAAPEDLTEAAKKGGSRDNITVMVVQNRLP